MDYYSLLKKLLPSGAYSDDDGSLTLKSVSVKALALTMAQANAEALLDEMHPETTQFCIADWERLCGLTPGPDDPLQTRQQRVIQQINMRGGVSRHYFIDLAAALGYTVTIDEYEPFMADIGCAGDAVSDEDIFFVWLVTVINSGAVQVQFCSDGGSVAGNSLLWWPTNDYLEGVFNRLKRASTFVIFAY